jgi:hypothetical protein
LAAEAGILSLAARGRSGGYGQVPADDLAPAVSGAGLDQSQRAAVQALAGGGDFLSVLTAPAGAGKTRTLGAAAEAWQQAGYRVIGLAPSARAAAELAKATGGPADTVAKWLHDHDRRGLLPTHARARVVLDEATVVIVDEASMANTLDLHTLISAAARKAAKVVLVGDPAQIGVVNGPGGMLAALARTGGVELAGVHRFEQDWERAASLGLRAGNPDVLTTYWMRDRLHPCLSADQAIAAVHEHWAAERAAGREVVMMARTRADVDALNLRARAGEQAAGRISGPGTRIGDRDWQTGDLLRTRRNDRRLAVGEGHVRNGDRYRVISGDPTGLLVEDTAGRGRIHLPTEYVAHHGEYGWAVTVDAAQGATVDVGILLARPGLDRERLYVAMTRGRETNHAYITVEPTTEADHHAPPSPAGTGGRRSLDEHALDVLRGALARSGAQDAANTARAAARARAADQACQAAEQAPRQHRTPDPIPGEHAARAAELTQRQAERGALHRTRHDHQRVAADAREQLAATGRWHPRRRNELNQTITDEQAALDRTAPVVDRLDHRIEELTRQVEHDARAREAQEQARTRRPARTEPDPTTPPLAPAAGGGRAQFRVPSTSTAAGSRMVRDQARLAAAAARRGGIDRTRDHGRGRDDGPCIGI